MPSMMRPANTIHSELANDSMMKPPNVPAWLASNRRLRPCRSDRLPITGVEISEHSAYTDVRQVAISGVAFSVSAYSGRSGMTIVKPRTSTRTIKKIGRSGDRLMRARDCILDRDDSGWRHRRAAGRFVVRRLFRLQPRREGVVVRRR